MFTKNKIGVAGWTLGKRAVADLIKTAQTLNFAGLTLPGDADWPESHVVKALLDEAGLQLFGLTPRNVDLAHGETAVRQAALDHYRWLLDWAAELGCPAVVCQGFVGRKRPFSSLAAERELLITAVSQLAQHAPTVTLTLNVLNRYESHLCNTYADALALVAQIGAANVGVSLGAFHMNIEEQDAMAAINGVNGRLALYHVADSNRQAIGRGHLKLGLQLWALENIDYTGPIIVECLPPHADPANPVHDAAAWHLLETYLQESRSWF